MSRETKKASHLGLINQVGRPAAKPPGLLRVIKKNSSGHYEQLLAHMFSATDDLFYDLSKRASSNQEQNLYFEAMREIRIKREGIANQFLRSLAETFNQLIEQPDQSLWEDELEEEESVLSIVKGDDLEIELAVSNMVSRTRDAYRSEIHEITLRLDHLLLRIDISEKNNPLDPQLIASAFTEACQLGLNTSIKAKLILFKLFEKHVLKQLGHVYADANQILLDAGILPKIPSSLSSDKRKGDRRETDKALDSAAMAPGADGALFDGGGQPSFAASFSMQQTALGVLLDAARSFSSVSMPSYASGISTSNIKGGGPYQTPQYFIGTAARPGSEQRVNCYIYSSNPGPLMTQPELTRQLTQTQQSVDRRLAEGSIPKNIVPLVVQELLAESDPEKPSALEKADENIINLVSLFFDQILADESLHVVVQALVCRLQIPILKVALRDASFFSESGHPARMLINTITDIGIGFDENKPVERDPVYRKLVDVVKMLNHSYDSDDGIFTRLQTELDEFVEKEKIKSTKIEQRTTQTEEGKARIKHARHVAQDLIYQKLKGLELPNAIKQFLITHWLQVLVVTNLKKGMSSKEWAANEQTITDLIWVSAAHTDTRSIHRRERMLPELLDRLEVELEVVISNPTARAEVVALLEKSLSREEGEPEPEFQSSPLDESEKDILGKGQDSPKAWSEMTAVEKQQVRYQELSANYFEMAKAVTVGTWVEYLVEETGKSIRCKLSSKMGADSYLFTNRMGFKVIEKTRKQLAYDMQFQRVKVLDCRPLFDRIMDTVVGNLAPSKG